MHAFYTKLNKNTTMSKITRLLCLILTALLCCAHMWAQDGPQMGIPYKISVSSEQWQDNKIDGGAFLTSAKSAKIKVVGAAYSKFGISRYYDVEFEWNDSKPDAIYNITGNVLSEAKKGNMYVHIGGFESSSLIVTVTNYATEDGAANATGTSGGGNQGGFGEGNGQGDGHVADYSFQNDADGDGVLEPDGTNPAFGVKVDYSLYPQKTDVPTIYITTDSGQDVSNLYTTKTEDYYAATIVVVDKNGKMKQRNETVSFRGRGNSTWDSGSKKKPWRLKFPSKTKFLAEYDLSAGAEINNYANAKSWTLLSNVYDKSLMRNALTAELGKRYGLEFCPAYRFVDLVVNGQYLGTYQVSDHMQVDSKRVNVDSNTGWFIEHSTSNFAEDPYIMPKAGGSSLYVSIKSPETATVTTSGESAEAKAGGMYYEMKQWLTDYWTSLNNAQYSSETDKYKAWRDKTDLKSLIGWMIIEDLAGNYDGAMANVYAYKEADASKLKFGPLWDLDIAYGNYSKLDKTHFWGAQSQGVGYLFSMMYNDPYFVKALYQKWTEFKNGDELNSFINSKVTEISGVLSKTQAANYNTTGDSFRNGDAGWTLGSQVSWCTAGVSSFDVATSAITSYLGSRITWIEDEYKSRYNTLKCDEIEDFNIEEEGDAGGVDPEVCEHTYELNEHVSNGDGTYSIACDNCGTAKADSEHYYKYVVYPESSESITIYSTSSSWTADASKPNSIAFVEDAANITGTNIINESGVCSNFVLADGHPFYNPKKFTATVATYSRNVTNAWGTVCLPFKMQNASTDYADFYHLSSLSSDGNTMLFEPINPDSGAGAYKPVVFKAKNVSGGSPNLVISGTNITVKASSEPKTNSTVEGWSLIGTMEQMVIEDVNNSPELVGKSLYYISKNQFWLATKKYTNNPFRAYFVNESVGGEAKALSIGIADERPTVIEGIAENDKTAVFVEDGGVSIYSPIGANVGIYTSGGSLARIASVSAGSTVRVALPAGVYVVNGVKFCIK